MCLDGSVRYFPQTTRYINPSHVQAPLLFLASGSQPLEYHIGTQYVLHPSFLNLMKTERHLFILNPLYHMRFCSLAVRQFPPREGLEEYSKSEVAEAFGWMCRYTLEFLDATLKDNPKAKTFIANDPVANGVPAHWIIKEGLPIQNPLFETASRTYLTDFSNKVVIFFSGFLSFFLLSCFVKRRNA